MEKLWGLPIVTDRFVPADCLYIIKELESDEYFIVKPNEMVITEDLREKIEDEIWKMLRMGAVITNLER